MRCRGRSSSRCAPSRAFVSSSLISAPCPLLPSFFTQTPHSQSFVLRHPPITISSLPTLLSLFLTCPSRPSRYTRACSPEQHILHDTVRPSRHIMIKYTPHYPPYPPVRSRLASLPVPPHPAVPPILRTALHIVVHYLHALGLSTHTLRPPPPSVYLIATATVFFT